MNRKVAEFDERLARNDAESGGYQKAQGAVTPGDTVEESFHFRLGVFVLNQGLLSTKDV